MVNCQRALDLSHLACHPPPPKVARKHDPEASRAAILDAAERLFLERGFAGASMSEIAKISQVTKSLIHHHFGSKDALWREIKRRRFASYHAQQTALFASGPSASLLRESMRVYFRFLRDNPETVRLMSWVQLEGDRELTEMIQELRDAGIAYLAAAQDAGVLRRDVPAPFILMTFVGLVRAWFGDRALASEADEVEADAYLDCAWAMFSSGAMVPGDAGSRDAGASDAMVSSEAGSSDTGASDAMVSSEAGSSDTGASDAMVSSEAGSSAAGSSK
jgi:TetR/AcrR family transcriptional regulator